MTEVISTYERLVEALESLPPPAPGHVRVFRGQNRDYGTMIPTGLRGPHSADMIWPVYASSLAMDIKGHAGEEYVIGADLDTFVLWVHAIKQHYGPGTEFLDVTHSPAVAAWFALHRMEWSETRVIYGPPGPVDPRTDVLGSHAFARYVPYEDEPAFLYVLDTIEGASAPDRNHGTLFDLALAPPAFSSSARIRAQQACLVYADGRIDGGDLSSLFVPGTPLRIRPPLEGWPEGEEWSTNDLFPPVADDQWYANFVGLPLTPNLRASTEQTIYDHPIKTTIYLPRGSGESEDEALVKDLMNRFIVFDPPLLYAYRLIAGDLPDPEASHPLWGRFHDATPLILEGPLLLSLPPLDPDVVNLGLLPTGLAHAAPARDFVSGRSVDPAGLENVFIELSCLDTTGWERAEAEGSGHEAIRAIWLVRDADRFFVTLFLDVARGGYVFGPVEIAYDPPSASFVMRTESAAAWRPLFDVPPLALFFVKALSLVRSLSPGWKLSPWAQIISDEVTVLPIEWALGELVSLRELEGPISLYYALRLWGTEEPFLGGAPSNSPARDGTLQLEGRVLGHVAPAELLEAVASRIAELGQRPPGS
jgi:FRG domain